MNDTAQKVTMKMRFARLWQSMRQGVIAYASPLCVCTVITAAVIAMELFQYAAAGVDALFSASPLFQSLWMTLGFSYV